MQRIALILIGGCLLALCTGGAWLAFQPPIQPLLTPNMIERQAGISRWEWTFRYHPQAPRDLWYTRLVEQLKARGWTRQTAGYAGRPLPLLDPAAYERRTSLGFFVVMERVELDGDLHGMYVRMRRWIVIRPKAAISVGTYGAAATVHSTATQK